MFETQEIGTFYTVTDREDSRIYRKVEQNTWRLLVHGNSENYANWELDLLEPIDYVRGSFS